MCGSARQRGPEPGPACYGRGGTAPTITDACLLMGILDADGFAAGEIRLDAGRAACIRGARHTSAWPSGSRSPTASRANIAEEVANVAIRHGVDPRDFSLIAYGAAGPMLLPAALEVLHAGG